MSNTLAVVLIIAGAGVLFFAVTKRNPLAEVGAVLRGEGAGAPAAPVLTRGQR